MNSPVKQKYIYFLIILILTGNIHAAECTF